MTRPLRYTERLALSEEGQLGDLEHDVVPDSLRNALIFVVREALTRKAIGTEFARDLHSSGTKHFGWADAQNVATALATAPVLDFLDLVEIVSEEGTKGRYHQVRSGQTRHGRHTAALPDFEQLFNELADRHRFGYRLEDSEVRRVGSPALSQIIVGPALIAAQRSGWNHVEAAFREALLHQRGGVDENDDALTAASAALESALKAVGMSGRTLGELAASFKRSELAAPQLTGVPDQLNQLLQRSAAIRNVLGDAHGKSPGDHPPVPQELVDLAIHLVGSFIVYVERSDRRRLAGLP